MADNNLEKTWDEKNQRRLDAEEGKYDQLCVWPATTIGEATPEQFEQFILEQFGARVQFMEEVTTLPGMGGEGGRKDLFFYVHTDDVGKFAIARLHAGIRWWEDVIGNNAHIVYPKDVINRYPKTW